MKHNTKYKSERQVLSSILSNVLDETETEIGQQAPGAPPAK